MSQTPLKWRLSTDGDYFEHEYWEIIGPGFSNYEVVWSRFITPITCRDDVPRDHQNWIHPKLNVDENLQRLSQAHYTIFRCLAANYDILTMPATTVLNPHSAIYAERYDMFYANLGTIGDMTSDVCFFVEMLEVKFGLRPNAVSPLTEADALAKVKDFIKNEYSKRLESFLKRRRSVGVILHDRPKIIEEFFGQDGQPLNEFLGRIRSIRNAALHNPIIGSRGDKVPKAKEMSKYELWANLIYNSDPKDFVDREKTMFDDFTEIQRLLNTLWPKIIERLEKISQQPGYKNALGQVPKDPSSAIVPGKYLSSASAIIKPQPSSSSITRSSSSSRSSSASGDGSL